MPKTRIAGLARGAAAAAMLAGLGCTASAAAAETGTAAPVQPVNPAKPAQLRNTRYCEVLTMARQRATFVITVYNTAGLNLCPADKWQALDAKAMAKQRKVTRVQLNGPRYWTLDAIAADGATASGKTEEFGGIAMTQRATLKLKLWQAKPGGYKVTAVKRTTVFTYKAGAPVFELVSPKGDVYMMQSYAQIVDPKLTFDDLATLGKRLKLPKGWKFRTRTLTADYALIAKGTAYVVQDDLFNTYQRRTK